MDEMLVAIRELAVRFDEQLQAAQEREAAASGDEAIAAAKIETQVWGKAQLEARLATSQLLQAACAYESRKSREQAELGELFISKLKALQVPPRRTLLSILRGEK